MRLFMSSLLAAMAVCSTPVSADTWSLPRAYDIALQISSTLPEGSVSQTDQQTLTFHFSDKVAGFDSDSVEVTGAHKGDFQDVSGDTFTLTLTATGGKVRVLVPSFRSEDSETAPAVFSNFYQDIWSIDLRGQVVIELIRIPAGTFLMGSPVGEVSRESNERQHLVTISQDFYLGRTLVTQEQWLAISGEFTNEQDHGAGPGSETRAVHRVSHDEIVSSPGGFLELLNEHIKQTEQGPGTVSLPTESQWEYACRAGTTTRFSFGDGLASNEACDLTDERDDNMWFCGNADSSTQLVGEKLPNPWGLYDMHGNLWEWCADWFAHTYPLGPETDPTGPADGFNRVTRGGSWLNNAGWCRSARRNGLPPSTETRAVGFRVVGYR